LLHDDVVPKTQVEPDVTTDLGILGVLALLAADREDRIAAGATIRRTETILSEAGFPISQIARILGKKYDTVHNALTKTSPVAKVRRKG
jgi:hypothetical protein